MADVITRFRLETSQYDSKLRDATKELGEFTRQAEKAGSGFAAFTQASIEQARALGTIGTSASNTKDKVRELVSAYNEVARAYNQLSEEQQKTDFGKALSDSLQQLQTRITDAKREMADMGNQGRETGGLMGILADKLTVNVDAMKLFSMGMAAAKGALDVAKDAFFNNEEQLDEWGRIVESSHSLYQGFLNSLNTGDISGFLKNMGSIVQAARDAYDALDALGTYNAFNQINVEKTRTGMTESIADYRMGQGSKEDVKAAGEAYKNELKERKRLERDAYLAAVKEMAAQRGVSEKDLLDAMSGTYGHYQDLKNVQMTGTATRYTPGLLPGTQGTYTQYKVAQNDRERLGEALRHLNDTELKSLQALGAQAERTGNEIAQVDRSLARVLNGNRVPGGGVTGGTRGGTARNGGAVLPTPGMDVGGLVFNGYDTTQSMNEMQAMLQTYQKALKDATTQAEYEAATEGIARMKELIEAQPIALKMGVSAETVVSWREEAKKRLDEIGPITIGVVAEGKGNGVLSNGKKLASEWQGVATAIQAVAGAMAQIEDPAAKVLGTVAQAVATVALSYAQALSMAAQTGGPWGWIAFAATGLATMVSSINAIKTATAGSYAEGGIVPGNNHSDGLIAHVSSGELILNRAQQDTLAAELTQGNGSGEGLSSQPYVSGEMIFLGLNNYLRRTGRGEILTAK